MLSRRQVFNAAAAHEKARRGVTLVRALWSKPAQAAASVVECGDYHEALAHLLRGQPTKVGILAAGMHSHVPAA
jgi:hypothetical protein